MLGELLHHLEKKRAQEIRNTKGEAMTQVVVLMSIGVHVYCTLAHSLCLPLHSSFTRAAHVALLFFRI